MDVVIADCGHQVPSYDRMLVGGLAAAGATVTFVSAPAAHRGVAAFPPGVAVRMDFGRLLSVPLLASMAEGAGGRHRRFWRGLAILPETAAFWRWVAGARPEIVHLQWSVVPLVDAMFARRASACRTAVVHTAHNVLPHERRPWHAASYRRLYRAVDRVIVHSEATRRKLARFASLPPDRAEVIPMPSERARQRSDRVAARRALGLAEDRPLVLFFGHLRAYKGLDVLVDAMPRLCERLPGTKLLVVGPAPGSRYAAALERRVARVGAQDQVEMRIGHVPEERVADHFGAADVVALPYRDTDDSAVLALARTHARAVVATAVGGLPEALARGGGLLVPPGEPAPLADALLQVLADPARRDRLESDSALAALAWTWPAAVERHLELYSDVLAARGDETGRRPALAGA